MCVAIAKLRESIGRYAGAFDPALVSAVDAVTVVDHAAAIEKTAATLKALAAARVADTDLWRVAGDRSAAHHLARTTGTTVGAAADALAVGRRLDQLPDTAAAARRGLLSASQVSAITDAAGADPSAEARLLDTARRASLQELKDDCARTRAAASADAEARRMRIHDRRYLRTYTDAEGAFNMHVRNNAEVGAEIMAVINPICDRLFADARAQGRREPHEAYAADALTALARDSGAAPTPDTGPTTTEPPATSGPVTTGPTTTGGTTTGGTLNDSVAAGCPTANPAGTGVRGESGLETSPDPTDQSTARPIVPTVRRATTGPGSATRATRPPAQAKVIVRIDLGALLRGYPVPGEVAELVGYGPVAVSVIRDMIDSGDPFLTAVATKGVDVVGVAHLGRRPTAHQRTALEWLYPTCAVEGCGAVARLEMDHRNDWATTHVTLFSLIDRLCPHHHRMKTRENWGLVDGRGKRPFVPPTDQRHPRHARQAQRPPIAAATGPPGAA